jgi:hypothetical protein
MSNYSYIPLAILGFDAGDDTQRRLDGFEFFGESLDESLDVSPTV